ncbi:hypothetical protein DITRI_Ditri10aG0036000 [Diplodiscus trichospermus]
MQSFKYEFVPTTRQSRNERASNPSQGLELGVLAAVDSRVAQLDRGWLQGPTLHQLLSFLKSKSNDQLSSFSSELLSLVFADGSSVGGPRLSFANGVWIDKSLPLKPSFKQIVNNVYKATSNQVDFQTKAVQVAGEVNLWAEKETNGLIKQVLPPGSIHSLTRLIFANALYFKGAWNEAFDSSKTKDHDFHLINGSSVKVPFMTSYKDQNIGVYDGFKVLGLPYKQGGDNRHFSMIPRFKISFGFEASEVLKGLGLVLPFSDIGGGLTEMVDSPVGQKLYVSSIFQKSFIEVNEQGTEAAAAAATACGIEFCCYTKPEDFVADHPFLFLIRENLTGAVLFVGHVLNPIEC